MTLFEIELFRLVNGVLYQRCAQVTLFIKNWLNLIQVSQNRLVFMVVFARDVKTLNFAKLFTLAEKLVWVLHHNGFRLRFELLLWLCNIRL